MSHFREIKRVWVTFVSSVKFALYFGQIFSSLKHFSALSTHFFMFKTKSLRYNLQNIDLLSLSWVFFFSISQCVNNLCAFQWPIYTQSSTFLLKSWVVASIFPLVGFSKGAICFVKSTSSCSSITSKQH